MVSLTTPRMPFSANEKSLSFSSFFRVFAGRHPQPRAPGQMAGYVERWRKEGRFPSSAMKAMPPNSVDSDAHTPRAKRNSVAALQSRAVVSSTLAEGVFQNELPACKIHRIFRIHKSPCERRYSLCQIQKLNVGFLARRYASAAMRETDNKVLLKFKMLIKMDNLREQAGRFHDTFVHFVCFLALK